MFQLSILHGSSDSTVPFSMGQQLATHAFQLLHPGVKGFFSPPSSVVLPEATTSAPVPSLGPSSIYSTVNPQRETLVERNLTDSQSFNNDSSILSSQPLLVLKFFQLSPRRINDEKTDGHTTPTFANLLLSGNSSSDEELQRNTASHAACTGITNGTHKFVQTGNVKGRTCLVRSPLVMRYVFSAEPTRTTKVTALFGSDDYKRGLLEKSMEGSQYYINSYDDSHPTVEVS